MPDHNGISSAQAAALLAAHGYNELPSARPKNVLQIAWAVMQEPMFILLTGCGALYLVLGDYSEGLILLGWVFVIVFITFYQHQKTEKSLEALRQLSSPRALVVRDGVEQRISGREVVPTDVVVLHEGDRIPADAQLLSSQNFFVDESVLTGESVPVLKTESVEQNLYSGTLVVQGTAMARVTATGLHTQFGKIGVSLQHISSEGTRLQREMKILIKRLFLGGALISLLVIAAFYVNRGGLINALLNGLAAAMALLPEEFPVVLTVFLALGAWRLSQNKVLTRQPSAIETLGSATVLCSDKTGTITQNTMQITALFAQGRPYMPTDFEAHQELLKPLWTGLFYACQTHSIDPMEKAIIRQYQQWVGQETQGALVREYALSKELFAMTRVFMDPESRVPTAYCKGAPEAIFKLCALPAAQVVLLTAQVRLLAQQGYRVLAAAQSDGWSGALPEQQTDFPFEFTGLVAFEDPIRPEIPQAVQECYQAGIQVIMITGDYPETARSIAAQIGLSNPHEVLTGADLQTLSQEELRAKMKHTQIFARIIPEQKLQIIHALKANGEIVAMTGDGVNDAPALKAADIGIAMGLKGTDVARESSALVLLDDHFASIVHAIRNGRRIFDNLQKAMSYIIAIHIPIIGLVFIPTFFASLPLLLMPLHIVFLELIIDPVCAIAFESEQEEQAIMHRPPRKPDELFFGWRKITRSLFKGLLLLGMVLGVYFFSLAQGLTPGQVRAVAFSSLILGNVFLILTSLSTTRSFIAVLKERNLSVWMISAGALLMLALALGIPFLRAVFGFEWPEYRAFIPALAGASLMLLVLEMSKLFRPGQTKQNS